MGAFVKKTPFLLQGGLMLANCKVFGKIFLCRVLEQVTDEDSNECIMVKILNGPYRNNTAYLDIKYIHDETVYTYILRNSEMEETIKVRIIREDDERYYLQAISDDGIRFSVLKKDFKYVSKSSMRDEIKEQV